MTGEAYDVLARFWAIQDARDYTALVDLFADDAVLEDPVYGTFHGRAAINGFMTRMNAEMTRRGVTFDLLELVGDHATAWAQWVARTPAGDRRGCGVYKVRAGRITYYRDFMDPPATR